MRKIVRYLVLVIVVVSLASIGYGLSLEKGEAALANKLIGFGVLGLFLLAMPLFLISESRGKNMKDYMLTDENIRKMRNRDEKSPKKR